MLHLHKILLEYNIHCSILFCATIAIQSWFLFQTNIFSFEILESIYKWKDSLNTVVFCSLWWLKIMWKVQWRLHKQTSKTFQMHKEKGKFKALAYTNWHIDSLRLHFARCECPKLFTCSKKKPWAKPSEKT